MKIEKACMDELDIVEKITRYTIETVYTHYYAKGAVDFFLQHHNPENIRADIEAGIVFLLKEGNENIGTVTVKENAVNRLFILPEYQKKGYGTKLMDFAEKTISAKYEEIILDASLPAKRMYEKRGYEKTESHEIQTENGDYLCYDVMKKAADAWRP